MISIERVKELWGKDISDEKAAEVRETAYLFAELTLERFFEDKDKQDHAKDR